jgi:small subunit ribosomal protein S1
LKKGDELDVQILNIDVDNEKISLGIKQLERDPWSEVGERYRVGDYVETSISKLVSFGAFARLDNGIEGLIHISELSKDRINKPEEVVHPGDKLIVKIISTDPATRKIGLSLKQYKQELEEKDISEYSGQEAPSTASLAEVAGEEISSRAGEDAAEESPVEAEAAHVDEETPPAEEAPQSEEVTDSSPPEQEEIAGDEEIRPEAEPEASPIEQEQPEAEEEEYPRIGTPEE